MLREEAETSCGQWIICYPEVVLSKSSIYCDYNDNKALLELKCALATLIDIFLEHGTKFISSLIRNTKKCVKIVHSKL